jgi:hypothetical protein
VYVCNFHYSNISTSKSDEIRFENVEQVLSSLSSSIIRQKKDCKISFLNLKLFRRASFHSELHCYCTSTALNIICKI